MQEGTPFIGENYNANEQNPYVNMQNPYVNMQNPYAVAIVKGTAWMGVLRIKVLLGTGQLAACGLFLQWSGNIECTIIEARWYCSDLPQGRPEVPCTLCFSGDAKLGRSYQLSTSKILILMKFNLKKALSTVNSSNLILCQIFPLYVSNQ